jgi:hypothetical protein
MDNTLAYEAGDCGSIPYAGTNVRLIRCDYVVMVAT